MKSDAKRRAVIGSLLLSMALMIFNGCARIGYDFNAELVEEIKIGETTQKDIAKMFGKPWRKGVDSGVLMWTYGWYTYRLIGETDTKDLIVKFDKQGKVSSYTFNTTKDE